MDGIKLLIIDRHEIAALGLLYLIMKNFPEIDVVRHATSGEAAMGMLTSEPWDIAVVDADTAGAHLAPMVGELSSRCPSAAVLLKYNHTSSSPARPVAGIDAANTIFMDFTREQVCTLLKRCIDTLPPCPDSRCNECPDNEHAKTKQQPIMLSPREAVVLGCIARGMTTKEIAKELFVSTNTVNTHRQHLLDKFGARNMVDLIIRAIAKGLVTV